MSRLHIQQIEQLLNTKILSVEPYRKNWLIQTSQGTWFAKENKDPIHNKWWESVDRQLRKHSFSQMPVYQTDGYTWTYTSYIPGRSCRYRDQEEVKKVVRALAEFHYAGSRCKTPSIPGATYLLWERIYQRIWKFSLLLKKQEELQGEIKQIVSEIGPEFYNQGVYVWNQLSQLPFRERIEREYRKRNLCHRDLASHNWIMDSQGEAWLIDFDAANYDAQIGDLWQISSRILTESHWDESMWETILSTYEDIRPLSDWEKDLLRILIGFPNEFFREMLGVVHGKVGYHQKHSLPYIYRMIEDRKEWMNLIRQVHYW